MKMYFLLHMVIFYSHLSLLERFADTEEVSIDQSENQSEIKQNCQARCHLAS